MIFVANHPHGLVDGMILADLIGRVRADYRILTRSLLTGIDEDAASYMIPVPFPHEPDAQEKMVEMRKAAMTHLQEGGLLRCFRPVWSQSPTACSAPRLNANGMCLPPR